jgi:hypothetical protein
MTPSRTITKPIAPVMKVSPQFGPEGEIPGVNVAWQ